MRQLFKKYFHVFSTWFGTTLSLCAMSIVTGVDACAEEFPWHEFSIDVPSMQNKLVIGVRQSHPLLAEYQYKVSGKLSNGKIFTAPLTEQTGGDAALTIDYIPKTLHSQSFIRFHLSDNRYNHNPADFLNLSTGKVEPERTSRMQGLSLGFIGSDARYYKPTLWNKQHQAGRFAMHSKNFKLASETCEQELAEARTRRDNDLISTSLYDLASVLRADNLKRSIEVERLCLEASERASNLPRVRNDGADVVPRWTILLATSSFYERQKDLQKAQNSIEQSIASAESSADIKNAVVTRLKLAKARLHLLQHHDAAANEIISEIDSVKSDKGLGQKIYWGKLYPYMILLENEIADLLSEERTGKNLSVIAKFDIEPSGLLSTPTIVKGGGAYADAMVLMGLFRVQAFYMTPLPLTENLKCEVREDWEHGKSSISLRRLEEHSK